MVNWARIIAAASAVLAFILAVGGVFLVLDAANLFQQILRDKFTIVPGSAVYDQWVELPVPMFSSIYLFNVTNVAEVVAGRAKPKLAQMGPYVYRETHTKVKIIQNPENDTITYQQVRHYYFEPSMSKGSLDDLVTTLNPPAASLNAMAARASTFVRISMDLGLKIIKEPLFVTKPARQIIFDGYEDPLLTAAGKLPAIIVPSQMDKFAYFYKRNGSDWFDGVFNMHTGLTDLTQLGDVATWNYTAHPPFFPGPCGLVRGAGDFFPPNQKKETLHLYSNDLCRPLELEFESDWTLNKIKVHRYSISPQFLANKSERKENWCFNPENEVPSGVYNATACRQGAPVFMSQPHFYQADSHYRAQVDGLHPTKFEHGTFFMVEPKTGVPLNVRARFQVNFYMEPVPQVALFKPIRAPIFFPTMWTETAVNFDEELAPKMWVISHLEGFIHTAGHAMIGACVGILCTMCVSYVSYHLSGDREDEGGRTPILNANLIPENTDVE